MATISSIGTTGRTYSTIGAWHTAFANGGWEGECYNDTEFNETPSIAGSSSVNYEILRTATGQSAFDTNTNPLKYDVSKGVGLKTTAAYSIALAVGSYCTVKGLQIWQAGGGNNNIGLNTGFTAVSIAVDRCLIFNTNGGTTGTAGIAMRMFGSIGAGAQVLTNSVLITYSNKGLILDYAAGTVVENNTIVSPSDKSNTSVAMQLTSGTPVLKNNAVFGFSGGFITVSGGTPGGSNNATDLSSVGFGTSNQVSLTFSSQFVGVASTGMDYRTKTGAGLLDNGVDDHATYPAIAVDIYGTSRPQGSAYDIGAHELISGSPPAVNSNFLAFM